MPESSPEWLRVSQVAAKLNLPLSSTYKLLSSGEIPFSLISRRTYRVNAAAVDAYLSARSGVKS